MWNARLTDIRKLDDAGLRFGFAVVFFDGTKKIHREYTVDVLDDATIKRMVRAEIAGFESAETRRGNLTLRKGDTLDLTPEPPPAPTPPDERTVFAGMLRTYLREQRATELGFSVTDTVSFSDLEKLWKPEFIDLV